MPPTNAIATTLAELAFPEPERTSLGERIAEAAVNLEAIRALPYVTPQDEADAAEIMNASKKAWEEVEEERTKITKPLLASKRAVDALFGPLLSKLKESETLIKSALVACAERRELANRLAHERAFAAAQYGNTNAVVAALSSVQNESPPPGIYFREVWAFEVTNPAEIPRSFLSVDEAKVKAFSDSCEISGLDPAIEGLRFFKRKIPVARG